MITNYAYSAQLERYIKQFSAIFAGMQIKTGKRENGLARMLDVPVRYGSTDRVVGSIMNRNTQNTPINLPIMSTYLVDIGMAPARRHGVNFVDNRVSLPRGGVFPNDLEVIERVMPIPYDLTMEASVYASSTIEGFQILEQIMLLFDPTIQIQTTDAFFDWTKLTTVELLGISPEENYPMGSDKRILTWNMQFMMPIWITPPANKRSEIVETIKINIGNLDDFVLNEYDDQGEPQPFGDNGLYTSVEIDEDDLPQG